MPERERLLEARPERLDYPKNNNKYRFYGNNILRMIDVAIGWEEGDMKDALVFTIANHMKKCFLNWNKDTVEDVVIHAHLEELSDGKLKVAASRSINRVGELLKIKSKNGNDPKHHHKQRSKKRKRY